MQRSMDRILSTSVGSLARPHSLLHTMKKKEHGESYDEQEYARQVSDAVEEVVRKQVESGLDVVTDGEQGKVSFVSYISERLGGLEKQTGGESVLPASWRKEVEDYPEYYEEYLNKYSSTVSPLTEAVCTGPVSYEGHAALAEDIENLKLAVRKNPATEAFMPATSPAILARNEYYPSDEEFMEVVVEALREEYEAIAGAGLLLQVDDPWLIEMLSEDSPDAAKKAGAHIERVNHALRNIPAEQVRFHTCYGLNHGPRINDLPFGDVVNFMLQVEAGAYSFEVANPRHQHEWRVWEDVKLPDGKILMPGFIGHATNYVEHPELISDGIVTYAKLVGRENVIASADCGFSSRATFAPEVHPTVVWSKFEALAEGAGLASKRLW